MPLRDEHLTQARHNTKFYTTIDKPIYKDWAVTILFYIGLHYVDAVLAEKENKHPLRHPERNTDISTSAELKVIWTHYQALKNASYNARYNVPALFTMGYINELETIHLAAVKARVGQYVTI